MSPIYDLLNSLEQFGIKSSFVASPNMMQAMQPPTAPMPAAPQGPGGAPPGGDPSQMAVDPSQGAAPPMDPAAMAAMQGGGAPPVDPAAQAAPPPADPAAAAPAQPQEDPVLSALNEIRTLLQSQQGGQGSGGKSKGTSGGNVKLEGDVAKNLVQDVYHIKHYLTHLGKYLDAPAYSPPDSTRDGATGLPTELVQQEQSQPASAPSQPKAANVGDTGVERWGRAIPTKLPDAPRVRASLSSRITGTLKR